MRAQNTGHTTRASAAVGMRRARSVTGPLRRAHPASGATWNVQVVRGKMSSQCLWHACRALSAGLLLMLLGGAMAVIGYYADILSVAQEVRGNATVSVKDEARGFHLNNLSYAGPIVMGFGGFIVVAACVMTFEARDSAAKVTPARPQSLPRPLPRRGPACAAPARLDQLGVYRLPHVLPLPHSLPLAPIHRIRPPHACHSALSKPSFAHYQKFAYKLASACHMKTEWQATVEIEGSKCMYRNTGERSKDRARFGSAPDLRSGSTRATPPVTALRRPLRRYALSIDEPPHSAVSASAAESECGSQSSLALDLHASGVCSGVTLRVRDNTRRRPLARQQRLVEDLHPTSGESFNNTQETLPKTNEETMYNDQFEISQTNDGQDVCIREMSPTQHLPVHPLQVLITPALSPTKILEDTSILIEETADDVIESLPNDE